MDTMEASNQAAASVNAPPSENEAQGVPSSSNSTSINLNLTLPTSSSPSPAAQGPTSTSVSNNAPGFRFKYPEAAPTPPGEDDAYWNRVYTAADSRMYNKHGKDANNSRKYRQNGDTRTLAFQMMAEKKAKEAAGFPPRAIAKPRVTQVASTTMSFGMESSRSRDGTPSQDIVGMSISEKIKADGRGRKTSSAAAPTSNRATPVPAPAAAPIVKPFNKRGTAAPVAKRSHKKKKVDHNGAVPVAVATPTSSARASQTPVPTAAPEVLSGDESDTSTRSGTLYCICRKPDDHSLMIECAGCEGWFHPRCMKIADEDVRDLLVDRFVCNVCTTPEFRTNFKRICRLYNIDQGCRRPARVNDNPPHQPSKYCSEDHKTTFWANIWNMLREDNEPSKGGALSRGEVTALLMACPNYEAFNALGSKPKLSDVDRDPAHPLGLKFLTRNEEEVLAITQQIKTTYLERIAQLKEQVKFLNMVHERARRATISLGKDSKSAICGYDARLAFNPDQFTEWYNSAEGKEAFKTGTLGLRTAETQSISQQVPLPDSAPLVNGIHPDFVKDMCLQPARKCKHLGWREMHNQEFTDSQKGYEIKIGNVDLDMVQLIEDAETREATKAFYAENRVKLAYD